MHVILNVKHTTEIRQFWSEFRIIYIHKQIEGFTRQLLAILIQIYIALTTKIHYDL